MSRVLIERFGSAILYRGDALDILLMLAEEGTRFAGAFADPPYSSGGNVRDKAGSTAGRYLGHESAGKYPEFQGDTRDQRSYLAWSTMWMARVRDLVDPGGLIGVFADWRQLPVTTDALQCAGWVWRGIVPWDKTESARPQRGRFRNQCEYVAWATNGQRPLDGPVVPGVFRMPVPHNKLHIAGKPEALMAGLLSPLVLGGAVLDPFAGSATIGVACVREGRPYVGIEVDEAYFDIACRRLDGALKERRC